MTVHRKLTRVGGSLAVTVPRDLAEAMGVEAGTPVRLSLVGRQLVVEPEDDTLDDMAFQRAKAVVLKRYAATFEGLAEYDRRRKR